MHTHRRVSVSDCQGTNKAQRGCCISLKQASIRQPATELMVSAAHHPCLYIRNMHLQGRYTVSIISMCIICATFSAGRAASSSSGRAEEGIEGAVLNVGGHVAALDWAPSLNGAQTLYLAVSLLCRPLCI